MHATKLALGLALASLLSAGAAIADDMKSMAPTGPNPLVDHVKAVNSRFQDVAVAVSEGYSPIPCASGYDGGSMGVHYVNMDRMKDNVIDISKPEAILYEPQAGGKLELVAVEYITFKGPAALEGHLFNFDGAPNRYGLDPFYELHVWSWRDNPEGAFTDMNPNVSCNAMTADGK